MSQVFEGNFNFCILNIQLKSIAILGILQLIIHFWSIFWDLESSFGGWSEIYSFIS